MRLLPALIVGCMLMAGCATTGGVPRPFPVPGGGAPSGSGVLPPAAAPGVPTRAPARAGSADGYSISSTALSLRGAPYRDGGADPSGFDCSGFVKYVFAQHGIQLPRDVRKQFDIGNEVDTTSLAPGDLVFFTTTTPGASHVGIVVGGDQFVHAPTSSGVVRVEHLSGQYWSDRLVGAKRVN